MKAPQPAAAPAGNTSTLTAAGPEAPRPPGGSGSCSRSRDGTAWPMAGSRGSLGEEPPGGTRLTAPQPGAGAPPPAPTRLPASPRRGAAASWKDRLPSQRVPPPPHSDSQAWNTAGRDHTPLVLSASNWHLPRGPVRARQAPAERSSQGRPPRTWVWGSRCREAGGRAGKKHALPDPGTRRGHAGKGAALLPSCRRSRHPSDASGPRRGCPQARTPGRALVPRRNDLEQGPILWPGPRTGEADTTGRPGPRVCSEPHGGPQTRRQTCSGNCLPGGGATAPVGGGGRGKETVCPVVRPALPGSQLGTVGPPCHRQ